MPNIRKHVQSMDFVTSFKMFANQPTPGYKNLISERESTLLAWWFSHTKWQCFNHFGTGSGESVFHGIWIELWGYSSNFVHMFLGKDSSDNFKRASQTRKSFIHTSSCNIIRKARWCHHIERNTHPPVQQERSGNLRKKQLALGDLGIFQKIGQPRGYLKLCVHILLKGQRNIIKSA